MKIEQLYPRPRLPQHIKQFYLICKYWLKTTCTTSFNPITKQLKLMIIIIMNNGINFVDQPEVKSYL